MRKIAGLVFQFVFVVFIFPVVGQQNDYIPEEYFFMGNELGVGARAIAMGGAFIGVSDDYSASYWNPAGLGQIKRMEFNFGFSHNRLCSEAAYFGEKVDDKLKNTRLNSLGFVFPVPTYSGSLVFGVGYQKTRDYDNNFKINAFNPTNQLAYEKYSLMHDVYDFISPDYPDTLFITDVTNSLQQKESFLEEGSRNLLTFSGAFEWQKNLYIGATLSFISGKDDRFLEFEENDINDLYNTWDVNTIGDTTFYNISDLKYWNYTQTVNSDISSNYSFKLGSIPIPNLKLGVLFNPNKSVRLGAVITLPTTYHVKENWSKTQTEEYAYENEVWEYKDSNTYKYRYQEPYSVGIGASFKKFNLLLSGDVVYRDWSETKFLDDEPSGTYTKTKINMILRQQMKEAVQYRIGAEYWVPYINARVRGGYFHDPSRYKDQTLWPTRDYYSGGLSLMLDKQLMFDLTYVHTSWQMKYRDDRLAASQQPVKIDKDLDKIIATVSVRF